MPNKTPELPEWMQIQIKKWASENAQTEQHVFDEVRYCGLIDGATEYGAIAIQLQNALALISEYGPDKYVAEVCREALALFPVDKKKEE